ncbi:MAG: hypothetical protein OEV99_04835 [Nitrospira sp.]|nr:hypothetical protein [Nitrospira sp.]MDH5498108.1 hypothetical protein [Nitrospira sp.]MDH5726396.1 hypothetical protein [Nitrospira sp.]
MKRECPALALFHLPSSTCPFQYGRAAVLLDDEIGSLPIEVWGSCHPGAAEPLPNNGDRVGITAIVHVLKTEALFQVDA